MTRLLFTLFFSLTICLNLAAQKEIPMPRVPAMRQLFHLNIDNAQQKIIRLSTSNDTIFEATDDARENSKITRILKVHINNLQATIELDSTFSESDKFVWLKAIDNLLNDFMYYYKSGKIEGRELGDLIISFETAMASERKLETIAPIIANNLIEIGNIILNNPAFSNDKNYKFCRDNLVLKMCQRQPKNILKILNAYPNVYFADSILTEEARRNQEEIYNYASARNGLGDSIRNSSDPLIKTITKLSTMNTGRMYFPFLDMLYKGNISYDTIAKALTNDQAYYKLLVKTEIDYAYRENYSDTPLVHKTLIEKLRGKAVDGFIDEINALHDEKSEQVRFKKIDSLSPTELYYLCVLGEEEIYTSSYLGVYKKIFERMKAKNSNEILELTHHDFYKKFIKMAAGYNQLDDFLKRMDSTTANDIMRSFVTDLAAKNTLEDAVDVADSYSSITNKKIKKLILDQVQKNLFEDPQITKRAEIIYRLLYTIFLSMDSANHVDLTKQLGINPVFFMPNKLLQDTSGTIIIQQFFYGDKDGKGVFESFVDRFRNPNWKITKKEEWIEVKSLKGRKITIYANKPLDTEKDLDAEAQKHLIQYMTVMQDNPTVVIHRGHSYYLKYTLEQLASSAKIVLLGSCGGYQSLNKVLEICPEAQIISSKQVGTGVINQELINVITEQLRQGKDLNWPLLWKGISDKFTNAQDKEKFNDYIPPHKNLGAIFIMAYEKAAEKSEK